MIRRPRAAAAAIAITLVLGACSVGSQDEPELLAPENVPDGLLDPSTTTTTSTPESATSPVPIYFVESPRGDLRLVPVERQASEVGSAEQRVALLLQSQPTAPEARQGLRSVIPPDTLLNDVAVNGETAVVDLTEEFLSVEGQGQTAAFAQVVFTATGTPGIQRVQFRIDGERNAALVQGGRSLSRAVDRSDYRTLRPRS